MDDDPDRGTDQGTCTCHVVAVEARAVIADGIPGLDLHVLDSDGDLGGGTFPLGVRASLALARDLVIAVALSPLHR